MRAVGLELLDDGEEVADRTGEPVKPDDNQGFARADLAEQSGQYRPVSISTGCVFFKHHVATGGAKLVELRIGALFLGGHPRVAHEAAGKGGFPRFRRHFANRSSFEVYFYNSTGYP